MKSPNDPQRACERFTRLLDQQSDAALAPAELAWLEEHEAACERCDLTHAVQRELAYDGQDWPAPAEDELTRHRRLKDIVDSARMMALEAPEPALTKRPWGWVAAAAAMLLAGVLAFIAWPGDPQQGAAPRPTDGADQIAHLVLRAGDVRLPGGRSTPALVAGQSIEVGYGSAALRLPQGSRLILGARARLTLTRLDSEAVELALTRGRLSAEVTKRRPGQRFEIRTPHGRVSVLGTFFSVEVWPTHATVTTHHGRVSVAQTGKPTRVVSGGQQLEVGQAPAWKLSAWSDPEARIRDERALALLAEAGQAAGLQVDTFPAGAEVWVDHSLIGLTPLTATLRPGSRRITLRQAGRQSLNEELLLVAGQQAVRRYSLTRTPARPVVAGLGDSMAALPPPSTDPKIAPAPSGHRRSRPRAVPRPPAPAARDASLAQLLRLARSRQGKLDFFGAAKAYRQIVTRFGSAPAACAARLSLGLLELGPIGRPGAALGRFDTYLARCAHAGRIAEASYRRIQALRALGRRGAEIAALKRFLKSFPSSRHATKLMLRLDRLSPAAAPRP